MKRDERGQATVEFALIVPVVLVLALVVVQVAMVASAQVAVTHAAREVARGLAVNPDADVGQLAREVTGLGTDALVVSVLFGPDAAGDSEIVSVSISYEVAPITGLFTAVSRAFVVQATAKMRVET